MAKDINQLQREVEDFISSKANGEILDLGNNFKLYYLNTVVDKDFITKDIKQIYFNKSIDFNNYFKTMLSDVGKKEDVNSIGEELIQGKIVTIYENKFYLIKMASKIETRGVSDIEREASFEGGAEGFTETIKINLNLITQYYHNPSLLVKKLMVGKKAHNNIAIVYDSAYIDNNLLSQIITELNEIDVDIVQSLNGLQQLLWKKQWLIPRILVTQRPDRVTDYIGKGKIIILLDGTPNAMVLPVSFHDFMKTVDDEYLLPIPALFLVVLRYLALVLSIIMPATYVAVVSYNPEVVRVQLAISIASSRLGVPYPSFIEVSIMLILMEFLIESSLRLPKTIGQAATTVGGLILGQAAIQAHLVSNIMIIIVSTVAISNFMIPAVALNLTVRVMKYIFLILVSFTGVYGIYLGLYSLCFYVTSIYTFNVPYFNPVDKISLPGAINLFRRGK